MRIRSLSRRLAGLLASSAPSVGGQAVMEGVMMRKGNKLAIAVRRPNGEIVVEVRPWFTMTRWSWLKKPFVRGFPILVETLVNGIKALNFSANQALDEDEGELGPWALAGSVGLAFALALGLFVVLPHMISLGLNWLGLSGGTESLTFHVWDGVFKLLVFLAYIGAISLVPDIRRVFQYHGAEHKTIWAFESGEQLTTQNASRHSRLHPRCGTTFLLFVLCLSIVLYAVLVPGLLSLWTPQGAVLKQVYVVAVKFLLMVPVSCLAYELIRFTGRFKGQGLCRLVSGPGLAMQMLTTFEPDDKQIEVAIAALNGCLKGEC